MFGTRKLGKTSTQRKAMMRQQVTDLLDFRIIDVVVSIAKCFLVA